MICPRCRTEITTPNVFCPHCGARLTSSRASVSNRNRNRKQDTELMNSVIIGVVALMCIAVVILLVNGKKKSAVDTADQAEKASSKGMFSSFIEKVEDRITSNPATDYSMALDLLEQGNYVLAQEMLIKLDDYEDARDLAAYAGARQLMTEEKYSEAADVFAALGDVRDARTLAVECQNEAIYKEAMAKRAAGEVDAAAKLFSRIPGVKDADVLGADCRRQAANAKIAAALEKQDWGEALKLLDGDDGKTYPNYDVVRRNCLNHVNYAKAKLAMEDKLYYTAFKLLSEIGDYEDAASLATKCQQPTPGTGELYRNPEYSRQTCRQRFGNRLPGGYSVYVRIYDSTGTIFVSSAFIRPNDGAVIYLPRGTYLFKAAYGKGPWYGEEEMFGDDAIYKEIGLETRADGDRKWTTDFTDERDFATIDRTEF